MSKRHHPPAPNLNPKPLSPRKNQPHFPPKLHCTTRAYIFFLFFQGWSEPPTWACPITLKSSHAGGGAAGAAADSVDFSEFKDPRYAKCAAARSAHCIFVNILRMYIEWLDVPPSFPGDVTRGSHPGFANRIAVTVFMNDLKVCSLLASCSAIM
jgi:hypothetical protein